MKDVLKIMIIAVIILKILISNINSSIISYNKFYKKETHTIEKLINQVNNVDLFNLFDFFGLDTGFGFFAPNVANNFIIENEVNHVDGYKTNFALNNCNTKEGKLRFSMMNQIFMEGINNENEKIHEYLDIVLTQINTYEKEKNDKNVIISTNLYLYDYVTLRNYNKVSKRFNIELIRAIKK